MSRILLLACCAFLTACAAIRSQEFRQVDPEEVAVVLGYQVAGSPSVVPGLSIAGYIAGLTMPGLGGLAVSLGSLLVNDIMRTDDAITMIDELNDDVYRNLEEVLVAKGYKVRLLKKVPIDFDTWNTRNPDIYLRHITQNYQLSEAELTASGADMVLYVEYRIDANVQTMEELTTMHAADLKVDMIRRNVRAFSMPPRNALMYKYTVGSQPLLNRLPYATTIDIVTDLQRWPDRTN